MSGSEAYSHAGPALAGGSSTLQPFSLARVWILALMAGLVAGFIAWLIGEATHARFAPPKLVSISGAKGGFLTGPEIYKLQTAHRAAQMRDLTLVFGALGAVLGLALGLAGGCARGSGRAALNAGVAGSIFGGIVAAAVIRVILPIYHGIYDSDTNDLIVGIVFHLVISSAIGAVGGAAFGSGLGGRRLVVRAAAGGLLGAAAGVLVYQILGAVSFPMAETSSPISLTPVTRVLAGLAVTTLASVGVAVSVIEQVHGGTSSPFREQQTPDSGGQPPGETR